MLSAFNIDLTERYFPHIISGNKQKKVTTIILPKKILKLLFYYYYYLKWWKSSGSPFKFLQQSGLGQVQARNQKFNPGLSPGWQGLDYVISQLLPHKPQSARGQNRELQAKPECPHSNLGHVCQMASGTPSQAPALLQLSPSAKLPPIIDGTSSIYGPYYKLQPCDSTNLKCCTNSFVSRYKTNATSRSTLFLKFLAPKWSLQCQLLTVWKTNANRLQSPSILKYVIFSQNVTNNLKHCRLPWQFQFCQVA